MFIHLATASLSLLIQSAAPAAIVQSPLTAPATATSQGSGYNFVLGVVQLQPTSPGTQQIGHANISGNVLAGAFQGNGALLSALNAGAVTTGTLNDSRLSSNIARLATAQVFSGQKTFSSAPIFSAAGAPFTVASSTLVSNLNCDLLDGLSSSAFLQSIPVPLSLNSPTANSTAILGTANSGAGAVGVRGNSVAGTGVYGDSTTQDAVYGHSDSGRGVWGQSNTGIGVVGVSNTAAGMSGASFGHHGVIGQTTVAGKSGVLGNNTSATPGPGVTGTSTAGNGLEGLGYLNGVQGTSSHPYASGVYGENNGGGYGVAGRSPNLGIGVYGESPAGGYGLYSAGSATITGDLYVYGAKVGYVSDIVRNVGSEPLEVGTLVEIAGSSSPVLGEIPVIDVRKATIRNARAALGPVACAINVETSTLPAPVTANGTESSTGVLPRFDLHRQAGAIAPGAYGSVVTLGSFATLDVDASFGPVLPGDLLVASPNPGYAMVSNDPLPGTLIGKALGALAMGTGQVAVIVKGD